MRETLLPAPPGTPAPRPPGTGRAPPAARGKDGSPTAGPRSPGGAARAL